MLYEVITTKDFEEQCYYHSFDKIGCASLYNTDIKKGIKISFDAESLEYFVQWKMMGYNEYVLGLEPGNCHPDGRDKMREDGKLVITSYSIHYTKLYDFRELLHELS